MDRRWRVGIVLVGLLAGLLAAWQLWPEPDALRAPRTEAVPSAEPARPPTATLARPPDIDLQKPVTSPAPPDHDPIEAEERMVDQILIDADAAFEHADLEVASHLFQTIIDEHPDSQFAPYAAYKLAWCRFNEGDRVEAIRSLELLAGWLDTSEVSGGKALAAAARKDLETFRATNDAPVDAPPREPLDESLEP